MILYGTIFKLKFYPVSKHVTLPLLPLINNPLVIHKVTKLVLEELLPQVPPLIIFSFMKVNISYSVIYTGQAALKDPCQLIFSFTDCSETF